MNGDKVKFHLAHGALSLLASLPLGLLYGLSDFLAFLAHKVVGYRLKVVRKNLRNSFPEKDEKELRKIEAKFYRHLCDCIVETVKLFHISDDQLRRRVKVTNPEFIAEMASQHQCIILYLGHYANWEWVPALTLDVKNPKIMGSLYKPLRSKISERITKELRNRLRIKLIPTRQAYRDLLKMKADDETFMIGFIADQRPLGQPLNHWTVFLNQDTAFVTGGETIGDRIGAKYLYLDIEKTKRGHYALTFRDMQPVGGINSDYPYTRLFYDMLEQTIRREPAYWLWSHNRWKAKKENKEQI